MENTIEIVITQEDIDKGQQIHCRRCPLARAAARATGMAVSVGTYAIEAYSVEYPGDEIVYVYGLPAAGQAFVAQFDRIGHSAVSPTTFVVERMR